MTSEDEDNFRLRKASEHIEHCRQAEANALRELASAREQLKRARDKHAELFQQCEARAVARRKAGLIPTNPGY